MLAYLIRRLFYGAVMFFVLTYAIWLLTSRDGIFALHHFQWDSVLPTRYQVWLGRILNDDLGYSIRAEMPVAQALRDAFGTSLLLLVPAFLLQEFLAIAIGILGGSRYRSVIDRFLGLLTFMGLSSPTFWLGLIAVEFFAVQLHLVPSQGLVNLYVTGASFNTPEYWTFFHAHFWQATADVAQHLVLPVTVLAFAGLATDAQYVRLSLVEVMSQDYIRSARARGLKPRVVLWKHALRNALVPLITNIGLQLPRLVFAGMLVELIFSIPGIGHLFALAIYTPPAGAMNRRLPKDYDVISAYFLVLGLIALLSTIVTDLIYAAIDPRIRIDRPSTIYAPNPLTSQRPVLRLGRVVVKVAHLAIAGVVVLTVGAGFAVTQQFIKPKLPSIGGTWYGPITAPGYDTTRIEGFMNLQMDATGKISGRGSDCEYFPGSTTPLASDYLISGDTDRLTTVFISTWEPLVNSTTLVTYIDLRGAYPKDDHTMLITGQLINQYGATYPVTMRFERGTQAAYQAACTALATGG